MCATTSANTATTKGYASRLPTARRATLATPTGSRRGTRPHPTPTSTALKRSSRRPGARSGPRRRSTGPTATRRRISVVSARPRSASSRRRGATPGGDEDNHRTNDRGARYQSRNGSTSRASAPSSGPPADREGCGGFSGDCSNCDARPATAGHANGSRTRSAAAPSKGCTSRGRSIPDSLKSRTPLSKTSRNTDAKNYGSGSSPSRPRRRRPTSGSHKRRRSPRHTSTERRNHSERGPRRL